MRKNKSFAQSVKCAVIGAIKAFRRERNFLIYLIIIAITIPINIWVQVSETQMLILLICICGAFSSECLNTAIEKLCDKIEKEYCEAIRYIKDVAAAAVLWWGIAYFGTEIILVLEKLLG